ncbi:hypothetical protein [Flavobacterium gawalongense]|uniref:Uncharacterized protein n=1 Tax=Flavobacterium gawalongense TaxID=2594432 RepID=A0A553BAN5_9FLAO|nr:hypothetical protein [Flavobacterium gawalongense]TRX05310.1 hypothetical protein FNW11_16345 [Flavobacterium gawalongense]TRX08561.1 hypothetical protein FNW10_12845 [Flavobacterium gawalongense]TRX24889.1 hypothetical protein FNW38_12655 [Flavobacterium gawalongense]
MGNKIKLFDYLSSQPLQGIYTIELEGDKRKKMRKRTAKIEVRFTKITIEASELSQGKAIRKLTLMMLKTIIKLFIMQIAYATEEETEPRSCFSEEEIECLELQMKQLEGKTEKLKNPYKSSDLKRYIWVIARLGGWKGYLSERKPDITTFWIGLQKFFSIIQGWILFRDVPHGNHDKLLFF